MEHTAEYVVLPLDVIAGERRYANFVDGISIAMARTAADGKPRALVMLIDETTAPMPVSTTAVSVHGDGDEH
jgi:hypothetical protein